jgi:hypothetical protein
MPQRIIITTDGRGHELSRQTIEVSADEANADTVAGNAQAQAGAAITQLRAYIALANPTAAQTTAAVKLLARAVLQLLRLVLSRYDDTD